MRFVLLHKKIKPSKDALEGDISLGGAGLALLTEQRARLLMVTHPLVAFPHL